MNASYAAALTVALMSAGAAGAADDPALRQAARAYRDMQQLCASLPADARDACVNDTRDRYRDELAEVRLPVETEQTPRLPFH